MSSISNAWMLVLVLALLPAAALASDPVATKNEHAAEHGEDAAGEHGDVEHGEGHGNGNEPMELPNLPMVLRQFVFTGDDAFSKNFVHYSHIYENVFYALMAGLILTLVSRRIYSRRSDIPGRLQSFGELIVEQVLDITCTMMGEKDGRKYAPFIATLFVYILVMNYSGLIPLGKAPTSTFLNNISLGITIFLYVQYTGIRRNGIGGYLHHLAGSPKDMVGWMLSPLMFFLEVVGEFIKPLSLSLRLFGNIFGEDMLLAVFALLGTVVLASTGAPFGLPLHLPFMFLSLMMGAIQALVFSLLAAVYISLMLPHDHDHAKAH
jgi:F-type H+-transporting ATPase subunit a